MQPRAMSPHTIAARVASITPEQRQLAQKLAKFLLVGGSGVLVNTAALYALHEYAHLAIPVAAALAVELAIVNNFLWNNLWTFGERSVSFRRFAKFNFVSLAGLGVTTGTVWVLSSAFNTHYLVANLAGIGLASAWNFVANMLWTWGWR